LVKQPLPPLHGEYSIGKIFADSPQAVNRLHCQKEGIVSLWTEQKTLCDQLFIYGRKLEAKMKTAQVTDFICNLLIDGY
jgi:hypothetical protein